jgi:PAS domain-containing protein
VEIPVEAIWVAVAAALVAIGGYLGRRTNSGEELQRDFIKTLQAELESARDRLAATEKDLKEAHREHNDLESQVADLRLRLELFESTQQDFPFPVWLKDLQFRMVYVNAQYEQRYLTPFGRRKEDYLGKFDSEIWPGHVAEEYRRHDLKVLATGRAMYVLEHIPEPDGSVVPTPVVKYMRTAGGVRVGVAGLALPHFSVTEGSPFGDDPGD